MEQFDKVFDKHLGFLFGQLNDFLIVAEGCEDSDLSEPGRLRIIMKALELANAVNMARASISETCLKPEIGE